MHYISAKVIGRSNYLVNLHSVQVMLTEDVRTSYTKKERSHSADQVISRSISGVPGKLYMLAEEGLGVDHVDTIYYY